MLRLDPRALGLFQGATAFLAGAFLFALSTVLIKFTTMEPYGMDPMMPAFARFAIGFILTGLWVSIRKVDIRPQHVGLVVWRGVLNTLAIVLFYGALQFTTVTNTNLLNLTYPVWIFLAAPLITRERSPWYYVVFLALTVTGVFLISSPYVPGALNTGFNGGDIMALASGIVAAFGIAVLRQARKHDGTITVIFWLFALGALLTLPLALFHWSTPPDPRGWALLLGAGLCGFVGQVFITYGYAWISATQGSLLSSSGIVFSVALGTILFGDSLGISGIAGAVLIVLSLIGASGILEKRKKRA